MTLGQCLIIHLEKVFMGKKTINVLVAFFYFP